MIIAENSLVSVYSDSMAFLLILGLTIIPRKRDAVDGTRERMFFAMCLFLRVLYVIPRIVSATFLFREWVVHSSEEKEKVADAKYCATV